MINSNATSKPVKSKYPYLGVQSNGAIVLFTSKTCGMVVGFNYNKNSGNFIGQYSEHWNDNNFTPFSGTVTLENE